jgi:hypothetical protein
LKEIEPDFRKFGAYVVSEVALDLVRDAEANLPAIQAFDHWGKRVEYVFASF